MNYYLVDWERSLKLGRVFYWRSGQTGYTTLLEEAGLYNEAVAARICEEDFDQRTTMVSEKVVKGIFKST
ncbi:hypothetical protein ACSU64_27845 [Bacillaceae bacterium C204]|uniref:hypothetical protein n=1 Tax=Neobacillus sp. 204 TaxID=3383351 RepID=UPI00397ADA8C